MKRIRKLFCLALSLVLILALGACSGGTGGDSAASPSGSAPASDAASTEPSGDGTAEAGSKGHILYAPIAQNPYFNRGFEFIKNYAEPLGYTCEWQGPVNVDPVALVNTLTDCLSKDIDILITTTSDPDSLVPICKQYMDKGTLVITWDLDVSDPSARDAYAGLLDLPDTGIQIVEDTVKQVGREDFKYAILNGPSTSTFLQMRIDRMKAYAAEKYPNMELVTIETSEGDIQKALTAAQNILTTYPDISAIINNSTENAIPICQAIDQAGKSGEIVMVGLGTPDSLKPYFETGSAGAISMWDPGEWAEWAACIGVALHQGKTYEEGKITEFPQFPDAEKIENETYYYNKMFTYDKDNVSQFDW